MKILDRSLEIARALYPADLQDRPRCFHLSFAYNKNKLIAVAENKLRSSPRNLYNKPPNSWGIDKKGTCSELRLFQLLKNTHKNLEFKKITLVNVRITREREIANSKPCSFCRNLLAYLNNPRLYFTNTEGKFELY